MPWLAAVTEMMEAFVGRTATQLQLGTAPARDGGTNVDRQAGVCRVDWHWTAG